VEANELFESDDSDPIEALQALLDSPPPADPSSQLEAFDRCAQLIARAPLGTLDIFAPLIRQVLGVTKETLNLLVQKARAEFRARQPDRASEPYEPSPDDISTAEALLAAPGIEERFVSDLAQAGVVREELNVVLLLLTLVSRLLEKPISLAFKGASSVGKSFLVECALKTLPPTEYIVLTAASPKALYYRVESLSHKVFVFMERPGAESSDYQIRVLQSEGKLRYSVAQKDPETGQIVCEDREIKGPVAYIETTTEPTLHDENETRVFSASVDESEAGTGGILQEQARQATGVVPDSEPTLRVWRAAHTLLQHVRVVIPFAPRIVEHFPKAQVRARRDFPRFLALIQASALLYQHQRERTPDGAVIATLDDYELARRTAGPLLEAAVAGVTKKTLVLIEAATKFADAQPGGRDGDRITATGLGKHLPRSGWSKPTIRRHLRAADRAGYLDLVESGRGKEMVYRLCTAKRTVVGLPSGELLLDDPEPDQPDQGESNADDSVKSNGDSDFAQVNQPSQGGPGQGDLFEFEEPTFTDPDGR